MANPAKVTNWTRQFPRRCAKMALRACASVGALIATIPTIKSRWWGPLPPNRRGRRTARRGTSKIRTTAQQPDVPRTTRWHIACTSRYSSAVSQTKERTDFLRLTRGLPKDLRTLLTEYDADLDDSVSHDLRYCMRLTILLQSCNRKRDLSLQFVVHED